MLIDYSIRSFEILERKLELSEKKEVFDVFFRVGKRMNLKDLPKSFQEFEKMRQEHLEQNLKYGEYTKDLYQQYRKHLGLMRYRLLMETQSLITPVSVRNYLNLRKFSFLNPVIPIYKISRIIKIDGLLKSLILTSEYQEKIKYLDIQNAYTTQEKRRI